MCRVLPVQTCTLDSGRAAATAIGRMKTVLEYGRVPSALVGPLVQSLLGILYVRYPPPLSHPAPAISCGQCLVGLVKGRCPLDLSAVLVLFLGFLKSNLPLHVASLWVAADAPFTPSGLGLVNGEQPCITNTCPGSPAHK